MILVFILSFFCSTTMNASQRETQSVPFEDSIRSVDDSDAFVRSLLGDLMQRFNTAITKEKSTLKPLSHLSVEEYLAWKRSVNGEVVPLSKEIIDDFVRIVTFCTTKDDFKERLRALYLVDTNIKFAPVSRQLLAKGVRDHVCDRVSGGNRARKPKRTRELE